MITLEQSRAMATLIRFEDDEHIPNTNVFKEGADTIDALCTEIERNRDYTRAVIAEHDALRKAAQMALSVLHPDTNEYKALTKELGL